jgi:hypothetical protein
MDAELSDSTASLELVQGVDGTERLAEGFLEASMLAAKEHKLLMSAKQLKKGRLHYTLDLETGACSRVDVGCCGVVVRRFTFVHCSCKY